MNSTELQRLNQMLNNALLTLVPCEEGLSLMHEAFTPIRVDFLSNKLQYRTKHSTLSEMVAKACGAKRKPSVLDLTAGLGRDAFLLASLGCNVRMIERNPIMHALLEDGLKRLKQQQPDIPLSLMFLNSKTLTKEQLINTGIPDVVYIDPMHPQRTKSALVKKEMRILRELVGDDLDKCELLDIAFNLGCKRIVIKWPVKAPLILSRKPTGSFKGKSTRFDVFQLI